MPKASGTVAEGIAETSTGKGNINNVSRNRSERRGEQLQHALFEGAGAITGVDSENDEFMGIYSSAQPPADSTGATLRMMATVAMTTTMNQDGPFHHELGGDSDSSEGGDDEEGRVVRGKRRGRGGSARLEGVERDKWGKIIRMCGIDGCTYKTGITWQMKRHKVSKHGIEAVRNTDDGKERDKWGYIIKVCGIAGCTFKTGHTTLMKQHKASKHGIEAVWKNDDGKERDKWGKLISVCGIAGCTYKT